MKKFLITLVFLFFACSSTHADNNLIFMDRFNGSLSGWTLDQTGGSVSIVQHDYSTKLQLNDTSGATLVSAKHTFTEPAGGKYIVEYDINYVSGSAGVMTLLDDSNNTIATLTASNGLMSFSTDASLVSTQSFTSGVYKQAVITVDKTNRTITAQISEDDGAYGSLESVGTITAYSGTPIAAIKFATSAPLTGIVYIDEVRVYTPDRFFMGDSRWDGKPLWSTHPAYLAGRLSSSSDETSSVEYQLQMKYSGMWVADRAFGGSQTSSNLAHVQSAVLDQGAKRFYTDIGFNDVWHLVSLNTITTNYTGILNAVIASGVTGSNIVMTTVFTGSLIVTSGTVTTLAALNSWILSKCASLGGTCVDIAPLIADPNNLNAINPLYDCGDTIHLNKVGSGVIANALYNAESPVTPEGGGNGSGTTGLGINGKISNLKYGGKISRLR